MPHALQRFRSYEIAEDDRGVALELWRSDREVVCLASDPGRHVFAELHVLTTVDVTEPAAGPRFELFRRQTQALMRLDHPQVMGFREADEDEGVIFYLTEFIDGEMLDTYLARCNPLPAWLAVEVAVQVTRGLLAIRHESSLLSKVDIFKARLSLEGEMTSDLRVRLSDFALGEPAAEPPAAATEVEFRAVRDVGRLLLYALNGMVSETVNTRTLTALPVPVELIQVLMSVLNEGAARPTTDLRRLFDGLEASRKNPALSSCPARLPQSLRPHLMLQSHFPSLRELAGRLGRGYRLERTAFDAVQPYAQRAFASDTQAVTVQLLPPARLMSQTYMPRIRLAAERVTGPHAAHLLRVLEVAPDQSWYIEESTPRLTLDAALRLRRERSDVEAALLLREIDRAVVAAEKLGLAAAALTPQQIFLDFITRNGGSASPTDAELSALRIDQWPPFRVRLRTHPIAAQFLQPQRCRRGAMPASGTTHTGIPGPTLRSPEAADYAALFTTLCGGAHRVPSELASLVSRTLEGSDGPDRRKLLDRITTLVPKPTKPATALQSKPSKPAPTAAKAENKSPRRSPARLVVTKAVSTARPAAVAPAPPKPEPTPVLAKATPDFRALSGTEPDAAALAEDETGGFAEMLFGGSGRPGRSPDALAVGTPANTADLDIDDDQMPVGTLFAGPWLADTSMAEPSDLDPMNFHPSDASARGPSLGRLLILIVLAALVIAIIMAHITGLAPWR